MSPFRGWGGGSLTCDVMLGRTVILQLLCYYGTQLVDDVSEREAALVGGLGKAPVRYRWDGGGFYAVLKARVKMYFLEKHGQRGVDPSKASVNRFVKVGAVRRWKR